MVMDEVAQALRRAATVLQRRPDMGLHDDAPATARWERGTRVVASHASGAKVQTDMPGELGGTGDQVSPGWLFRAGLATCAATCIAMRAATEGIELTTLEVKASSRSDTRGVLGMADDAGERVYAGPCDVQLRICIAASGASAQRLRALVDEAMRCSPIPNAVKNAVPMTLHVEVAEA
jgi:organic hydroperoxide reductase OsmC/OhrA